MAYQETASQDEYLEAVERYQDYEAGTYQTMTIEEKMDFFVGVHTNHVPLFDEDGDDMDTSDDYYAIRDDFLEHPEQFYLEHISEFLKMLDDSCYQPSFMDTIVKIIHNIVRCHQAEGVAYLLSHLQEVPSRGYEYGLFWNVRYLLKDDSVYSFVKEALARTGPKDRGFLLRILEGANMPAVHGTDGGTRKFPLLSEYGDEIERKRKAELEELLARLPKE